MCTHILYTRAQIYARTRVYEVRQCFILFSFFFFQNLNTRILCLPIKIVRARRVRAILAVRVADGNGCSIYF